MLFAQDPLRLGEALGRVDVVRASGCREDKTAVLLTVHHIACDGVSIGVCCDRLLRHMAEYVPGPCAVAGPERALKWGGVMEVECRPSGPFAALQSLYREKRVLKVLAQQPKDLITLPLGDEVRTGDVVG